MKWLIKAVFKVVKLLINIVLAPINLVITELMPATSNAITSVNQFFDKIKDGVLWVKSWLPFDEVFYIFLFSVLSYKFLAPLVAHSIHLVVGWYNKLKP